MKLITFAAVAAGMAVAGAASATPNLVQNGGFETTTTQVSHQFGTDYIYGNDVANWQSNGSSAYNIIFEPGDGANDVTGPNNASTQYSEYGQFLWALPSGSLSPNGGNFVALDASSRAQGALTQAISGLQVGGKYALTFYWATAQLEDRSGSTMDWLTTTIDGQTFNTAQVTNPSEGATGWYKVTDNFTYTGGTNVLSFLANSNYLAAGLPPMVLLDGVSINAVPEPATWAMMLVGFGVIGYGLRRRRAAVVA